MNLKMGKLKGATDMIFGVSILVLAFLGLAFWLLQPYSLFGVPVFYLMLGIASTPILGYALVKLLGIKG